MKTIGMIVTAEKYLDQANSDQKHHFTVARVLLDRAQHSCQQWWASKRPWYSVDMIIRGLQELILSAVNVKKDGAL